MEPALRSAEGAMDNTTVVLEVTSKRVLAAGRKTKVILLLLFEVCWFCLALELTVSVYRILRRRKRNVVLILFLVLMLFLGITFSDAEVLLKFFYHLKRNFCDLLLLNMTEKSLWYLQYVNKHCRYKCTTKNCFKLYVYCSAFSSIEDIILTMTLINCFGTKLALVYLL